MNPGLERCKAQLYVAFQDFWSLLQFSSHTTCPKMLFATVYSPDGEKHVYKYTQMDLYQSQD